MTTTLIVGMIEFDNVATFAGVGRGDYDQFEDALARANALMNEHSVGGEVRVFVAPEYYFSGHAITDGGGTQIQSHSRDEKHKLYDKIKSTSSRYPDVLLIPGSIAYGKGSSKKRKYYGVCPIAAGGRILKKYYKQSNDTFQSETGFTTKNYGATFTHRGIQFGIDICLDHGHKRLKDSLGGGTVDVHVLISDGSAPSSTSLAAPIGRGVVVFCDMNGKGKNGVLSIFANKFGNANTKNESFVARHGQALAQGAEVALYRGAVG